MGPDGGACALTEDVKWGSCTAAPTGGPTSTPSTSPTDAPSASPTSSPTGRPTDVPTAIPTTTPTETPITAAPTGGPTSTPSTSPTDAPSASPTSSPTESANAEPSTCFDFVMEDTYGDGWNGAVYSFYDTTTAETIASRTLSSGFKGTDVICFSMSGCYTLSLTTSTHPNEISWSFGSTVSGVGHCTGYDDDDDYINCVAPPEFLWLEEDGTLAAGSDCPTE